MLYSLSAYLRQLPLSGVFRINTLILSVDLVPNGLDQCAESVGGHTGRVRQSRGSHEALGLTAGRSATERSLTTLSFIGHRGCTQSRRRR